MDNNINIPQPKVESLQVFKKTQPLNVLLKDAEDIQNNCSDYNVIANGNNLHMYDDLTLAFKNIGGEVNKMSISDYAFGQLCNKADMGGVAYLRKCISKGYIDLVAENVNTWVEDMNKPLFLRTYNDKIRGVLSDRYAVLDTPDIIKTLSDSISSNMRVKSYFMNEERFHARLISPTLLDIAGEDLYPGLMIDSSDVGRATLTVKIFIFKQVCTNGLTVNWAGATLFQQKHLGISTEEFQSGLESNFGNVDDIFTELSKLIVENKSKKLTKKQVEDALESFRAVAKVGEDTANNVIDLMSTKYGHSKWGMINSITEVAQKYTLDRRLELEAYAGGLLVA